MYTLYFSNEIKCVHSVECDTLGDVVQAIEEDQEGLIRQVWHQEEKRWLKPHELLVACVMLGKDDV